MFLSHGALALGRGHLAGAQRFLEYRLAAIGAAVATVVVGAAGPTTRVALAFCIGETVALAGLSAAVLIRRDGVRSTT